MTADPVILCCGEAVADLVPAPLADGGAGYRPVPGGAAANTARALSRMRVPAGFVGALSRDTMGVWLDESLRAAGVGLDLAEFSDRPSTLSLAHPVPGGTKFDLFDADSAGRFFGAGGVAPALPETVRVLVLGGLSLIHPPAADAFEALAARAAGRRLIWIDLNIRPGLVGEAAPYRARLEQMMAMADVIKVSDEDLDWLGLATADALVRRAGTLVLHTRGAAGALALWRGGHLHCAAPAVEVSDTVGAGDVFNAGMLASLWRTGALDIPLAPDHAALAAALAHGVRAASFSVARPGPAAPAWEEVA